MRISDWSSDVCSSDLLPGPPDRIGQMPFQLRRIEGALARQLLPAIFGRVEPSRRHRVAQFVFRLIPHRIAAEALFGTQGQLDRISEAEILVRSEEHTSELQSLMRITYADFCLKNKQKDNQDRPHYTD